MDNVDLSDRSTAEETQLRRLMQKHRDLDERLARLQSCRWLSEQEQLEEIKLKKMKLAIKDELESLQRRSSG